MMKDLSNWSGCPRPQRVILEGRFARLEPLDAKLHGDGLYAASTQADSQTRFRWLFETKASSPEEFQPWLEKASRSDDPLFFVVIDKRTGKISGRQALMRIDPVNGVIEIGNILWNADIAGTPVATEAMFLFMEYAFDELGYRRYEWKCHNENEPSKKAAMRFGLSFEGIFRQHMVAKGRNRDTAWFAMIDSEWPLNRAAYQAWLDPQNFDEAGKQRRKLEDIRASPG